jgi:hypothetical protein
VSKRYRILVGSATVLVLLAIGGIAAAEQGGQSGDHRQNPTTTSGPSADSTTTTTTSTTLAPQAKPQGDDVEGDAEGGPGHPTGLCWAITRGSPTGIAMKTAHGQAFQNLDCGAQNQAPVAGDEGDVGDGGAGGQGQGGPPAENPGQGHGQGQGGGPDNPNAQGHGKP